MHLITSGALGAMPLLGRSLTGASGARLRVGLPTPALPGVLRDVARENRWRLRPSGRPACSGVDAEVDRAGPIRVGERLVVRPRRAAGHEAAVAETVRGLAVDLGLDAGGWEVRPPRGQAAAQRW